MMIHKHILPWKGGEVTIPETKWFKAVEAIEQYTTLDTLWGMASTGAIASSTVASAAAAALQFAGVETDAEEVCAEIVADLTSPSEDAGTYRVVLLDSLLGLMLNAVPKMDDVETDEPSEGEATEG